LANRNDVWQMFQKGRVASFAWHLEERHGTLRLGRPIEVYNSGIWCKVAQLSAVFLNQEIANEEGISKGGELSCGAANKNLTHGGSQVRHRHAMLFHPFRKQFIADDISRRDNQFGAWEEWGEISRFCLYSSDLPHECIILGLLR
jgi:hypothetical protein